MTHLGTYTAAPFPHGAAGFQPAVPGEYVSRTPSRMSQVRRAYRAPEALAGAGVAGAAATGAALARLAARRRRERKSKRIR